MSGLDSNSSPPRHNRLPDDQMQWQSIMDMVSARIRDQEMTRGNISVLYFTLMTIGLSFVTCLVLKPSHFLPFILAMLPALLLILYVSNGPKDRSLSSVLIFEFLWFGGILSVIFACGMEVAAMSLTYSINMCNVSVQHPTLTCDIFFIISFILAVGLSEEFAKILPLARITTRKEVVFRSVRWWHRYVDNPAHLVILGTASGVGFATVENIKYVFTLDPNINVSGMIKIAVFRGLMSVPLHFACTGIAACIIALNVFKYEDRSWKSTHLNCGPLARALALPSILHGLYDAFIYLSIKTPPQLTEAPEQYMILPKITSLVSDLCYALADLRYHASGPPDKYQHYASMWAAGCAAVAFSSFAIALISFMLLWAKVLELEEKGLPYIHDSRVNCPIRPISFQRDSSNVEQPLLL